MKRLAIAVLLLVCQANGLEWTSYDAFETDVTNAMAHVDILMSSDFTATNAIHQWDATVNCYNGGALYQSIATHFGVSKLTPRQSLVFAAAHAAKMAGLLTEYTYYKNLLPSEIRSFLDD